MGKKEEKCLVIVESPNKIKVITRILGSNFTVMATAGHIMVINSSGSYRTGVDTKNNFKIDYVFDPKKKILLKEIKAAASKVDKIYVCSDDDREGHKISDEIRYLLKDYKSKIYRSVFNEITEKAVKAGIANPIPFDEMMISAAETRGAIDRLVGYRLSPIALSKLNCESAGRVQSALLRLICEKEETIMKFVPTIYWEILLDFKKNNKVYTASLYEINKKKIDRVTSKDDMNEIIANCSCKDFIVESITSKNKELKAKLPLTTAALQQIASNNLGFSPSKTMTVAQHLFEKGYITYLRTDAVRFSDDFIASAKSYIEKNYKKDLYIGLNLPKNENANAQDAHESIRPTNLEDNSLVKMKSILSLDELKLYTLIYNYSLASFFKPAVIKETTVLIANGIYKFKISGEEIILKSFLSLYGDKYNESELPTLQKDETLTNTKIYSNEKQTQPPQRYSEAGLVKLMQDTGIGRPSSFSPTIETLKKREYINIEKRAVHATEKGMKLNKMLTEYFSEIINTEYTSNMEKDLDEVSSGEKSKSDILTPFWKNFEPIVLKATREINKDKPAPEIVNGIVCPKCGSPVVIRNGKYGQFYACSKYPKCKWTGKIETGEAKKPIEVTDVSCPDCKNGKLVRRISRKGEVFYGCSNFPKCRFTANETKFQELKKK